MAGLSYGRRRLHVRGRLSWQHTCCCFVLWCILWLGYGLGSVEASPLRGFPEGAATAVVTDTTESESPVVTRVRFEGGDAFPTRTLTGRVRTEANRRFAGIPGLTWWVWLYELGDSGRLGDRIGRALMSSGEPPAVLDASVLQTDVERLEALFQQEGFREAAVEAQVDTSSAGDKARVTFVIDAGPPTYLRRVTYDGLESLSNDQRRRLMEGTRIPADTPADTTLSFHAEDQRYSEPLLLEERRRLLTFLRNEGYAAVARDSIRALVRRPAPDSFDVDLRIRPGPRYRFGDVHVDVTGPEAGQDVRKDTLSLGEDGRLFVTIEDERRLRPALVRRALQFEPGAWYSQEEVLNTRRRLEATGVFGLTDISTGSPEAAGDSAAADRLPQRIQLRTQARHRVRLEMFALQRSGALGVLDNELGTGLGLSYNNLNLLGGGEAFQVRLSGSIAGDIQRRILTTSQVEASTSLQVPYLIQPFSGLDDRLNLYDARTRLSFSLLSVRSPELRFAIRGRGSGQLRLELQHNPTVTSLVDIPTISFSNPDTLAGFGADVLDRLIGAEDDPIITDPVQRAQVLEDYTQPQFNNALRYTLRATNVDPLRRRDGYSYEGVVEVGGHVPYMLDRWVLSPDSLTGRLPIGTGDGLLYRPYLRLVADARQYRPASRNTVIAGRLFAGFAQPTGPSNVVPFDRRFYSGGASSVRGWRLRELGPGSVQSFSDRNGATSSETNLFGGDIKLEASVEVRRTLFRNFLAADWIGTVFMDAGNVWFGPSNPGFQTDDPDAADGKFRFDTFFREVAVGSGVGVRLSWEYIIARFDLGWRVVDPANPSGGIFPADDRGALFNDPAILHFGIGHTF